MQLVIRSQRVLSDGRCQPQAVLIRDEKIVDLVDYHQAPANWPVHDVHQHVIMAGLVDSHVHVNEPGRTAWEGFASATRAAAAGGVTTLVDMPLNSIPATTSTSALLEKKASTSRKLSIDVGLWGGVVPGNSQELLPMVDHGALGFKCFLIDSGVPEFAYIRENELPEPLRNLREANKPLLVHAELAEPIVQAEQKLKDEDFTKFLNFLKSRPRQAEDLAVAMLIRLCRDTRAPIHIVHHSSSNSLSMLEAARHEGLPITVETCPHYLFFSAEDVPDRATHYKCVPPIRENENRDKLWDALEKGIIDQVVSDHSPCVPELKRMGEGNFATAWGGISSLQLGLSVVWSEYRRRGGSLTRLHTWMSAAPARLAGLATKGKLAKGYDADLIIWNPEETWQVKGSELLHRHPITPYDGKTLFGQVLETYVRGHKVYDRGHFSEPLQGKLL